MKGFIRKTKYLFDFYSNRYQCFVASVPSDIRQCLKIRETVFGNELGRKIVRHGVNPATSDELDKYSFFIACRDKSTNKIVGCLRLTKALHVVRDSEICEQYKLKQFKEELLDNVYVISRYVILPEYRKTPAGVHTLLYCYEHLIDHTNCALTVIVCEPSLYSLYGRLGFRCLDRIYSSGFGGYRVPLYLHLYDYQLLEKCQSPLYRLAKKRNFPEATHAHEWLSSKNGKKHIDPGFEKIGHNHKLVDSELFNGLSKSGKQQLFRNAIKIVCNSGDCIIDKEFPSHLIGVVQSGKVHLTENGKTIMVKRKGDIFGEVSFLLNTNRKTDIIAAKESTEIIMLSISCIKHLKNVCDQAKFWENMAKLLGKRINAFDNKNYKGGTDDELLQQNVTSGKLPLFSRARGIH